MGRRGGGKRTSVDAISVQSSGHDESDDMSAVSGGSNDQKDTPENDDKSSTNNSTTDNESKGTNGTGKNSATKEKFVQKESQFVTYLRILVLVILLLAAIAICCVVYIVTSNGEEASFDSHYAAAAEKVSDTFMEIATNRMGAAGSLVVAIVAHSLSLGNSWPFVTLSSFQERAATVMRLSGSLYIGVNPVVKHEDRMAWENYSTWSEDAKWYQEAREYQEYLGFDDLDNRPQVQSNDPRLDLEMGVANHIYDLDRDSGGKAVISPDEAWYLPIWQTSPVTKRSMVNQNRASNSESAIKCIESQSIVFEGMQYSNPGYGTDDNPFTAEIAWLLRLANREKTKYEGDIFSTVYLPLYDKFFGNRTSTGVMRVVIHWARFFANVLPESTQGVVFVLENGCDEPYTYQIDGKHVQRLGHGDLHDPKYDEYMVYSSFRNVTTVEDGTAQGLALHQNECPYALRIYPSDTFAAEYNTNTPTAITCAVAFVFIFTIFMFFVYDRLVERRQKILLDKATRTHQIVASLFPKHVRDQILHEDENDNRKKGVMGKHGAKGEGEDGETKNDSGGINDVPIADLFPEATVLFADIAGFTAWSSSREPQQVFILLQNVYHAFDTIAKNRKVFKVETVGDSYVAAAGVPEPQPTHAVIMSRFAWECLLRMQQITRDLESTLGPDTGELTMRFGIHSGPVTAGVLRGERSRFQLFGDTVNTASRMESTGVQGRIQCSQSTAEALTIAGKEHWVRPRHDVVMAKGKGVLKTFWVVPSGKQGSHTGSEASGGDEIDHEHGVATQQFFAEALLKREREIDWVAELLKEFIRLIVAKQDAIGKQKCNIDAERLASHIPLDDVVEAIQLPDFNAKACNAQDAKTIKIPERICSLLRQYVSIIASAYKENPFHNFEHACHVTMCVSKFIKRIVAPDMGINDVNKFNNVRKLASHLHDYTHGINSDPITQFAIVFSAVIHDVDHRGISNVQLGKEEPAMGKRYKDKSTAEQNSFEISWDLLMSDHFRELRSYVFASPDDLVRFRQVVVNVVLATDIFDKELNELRKTRWQKAFSETAILDREKNALRATIVMEHIMQASDVSHVMQHWHVYQRWNRRLFQELLRAHRAGRMAVDPSTFWYKGEISFFDNYIIPLAKKLKDCNVFGVSSDECLNYALRNREEWEARGESIVACYMEEFSKVA